MSNKTRIKLDLTGIKAHTHLVHRVAKRMDEGGATKEAIDDLKRRLLESANPLTTGQILGIITEFCEIE